MDTATLPAADGPFPHPDPKSVNVVVTRDVGAALAETLEAAYTVHNLFDADERRRFLGRGGDSIEAVVTSGLIGLGADEMDLMPNLGIIHTFASGYEQVDVAAARARGIMVCHVPGLAAFCVAEHAIGLMIAVTRGFVENDRLAREIHWDTAGREWPTITGKRLGILGLGNIGAELAKRAQAFDMEIGYHGRTRRSELPYPYFETPAALAEWSDYLVASLPSTPATKHIVNAEVLARLGPKGYFINVARGTVADTEAIVAALESGTVAGAALDVVEGDPEVPLAVLDAPNLLLTPHIAGRSPESVERKLGLVRANIENHLTGAKVLSPVPEMAS